MYYGKWITNDDDYYCYITLPNNTAYMISEQMD